MHARWGRTAPRAFTLMELAVALAIAGIIALACIGVFAPVLRTIKQAERMTTLATAATMIDDHLRMLLRNVGGGALDPGMLVTVQDGVDVVGTAHADRLIVARAIGNGVRATRVDPPGGGSTLSLAFDAVVADGGGPQCPLTAVPLVGAVMKYDQAQTFFGPGTPVLVTSSSSAAIYVVQSDLTVITDATRPDFQSCLLTVARDTSVGHAPLVVVDELAIFVIRKEVIHLDGTSAPAPLVLEASTPAAFALGGTPVIDEDKLTYWPAAFDLQVQMGFDVPPGDGVLAPGEWLHTASSTCATWPTCLTTRIPGAHEPDLRMVQFGAVVGEVTHDRQAPLARARALDAPAVSSTTHTLRALEGRVMLRNGGGA